MKKTQSQKIAEQNRKAIEKMRKGAEETAELQKRVGRGEITAAEALRIKCKKENGNAQESR